MLRQSFIIIFTAAGILLSAGQVMGTDVSENNVLAQNETVSQTLKPTLTPFQLRTWGDETAAVSIYVFSSLTCPHCAVFHADVLPDLKETFIDSGKAKLIYVDMPYDARAMTGTLLARCIQPALYEPFMTALFENQHVWAYNDKPRTLMDGYARVLGADVNQLKACVANEDLRRTVTQQRNNLSTLYKVTGMPTVIVVKNGTSHKITGTDTKAILSKIKSIVEEK